MSKKTKNKTTKPFPFRIGADPEFTICLTDKRVNARALLETFFKDGRYTKSDMGFKIGTHGELGWDSHTATGELRPTPAHTPKDVITHLGALLKEASLCSNLFEFTTKSDHAPIGGHIHLELSRDIPQHQLDTLHKNIASFYLPLFLSEDKVNQRLRNSQGYGKISDFRVESPSGSRTYEFRTPSAEWLTSPKLAEATLAYLAVIYNEAYFYPDKFKDFKGFIVKSHKAAQAMQEITMLDIDFVTKSILYKVKRFIKDFEYYPHYKSQIDFLLRPHSVLKEKDKYKYDILKGWKLEKKTVPTKRQLMSDKQIEDKAMTMDIDKLLNLVSIHHNPDTNIQQFVHALKTRILTLNWKLGSTYFLYGLKNGINPYIISTYNKDNNQLHTYHGRRQIKTIKDYAVIESTVQRMLNKVPKRLRNNTILVGIPYKERIRMNYKPMIELIHKIEKKELKSHLVKQTALRNDSQVGNNADCGKLFQIYNQPDSPDLTDISDRPRRRNNNNNPMSEYGQYVTGNNRGLSWETAGGIIGSDYHCGNCEDDGCDNCEKTELSRLSNWISKYLQTKNKNVCVE